MASPFAGPAISILVGAALIVFSGGTLAPAGIGLILSGVFAAAAIALAPDRSEATDEKQSPTYGFAQFRNPVKGDSPIPVIYSAEGHKTAPVWLQAFVTPRGLDAEDERRSSRYQRLSGLLAVAEGTIEDISDLRFNDEPVFETIENYRFGTGDGSRKSWTLPQNRVEPSSVVVSVDGVAKGFLLTSKSELIARPSGTQTTFSVALPDDIVDSVPVKFYNIDPNNQPAGNFNLEAWRVDMNVQMVTPSRLLVHSDVPRPPRSVLYMKYGARTANGLSIRRVNGEIVVKFDTAPTNGAKLTVSMRRKTIPNVDVHVRYGSLHQLPIWGFHQVRNTFGVQQAMPQDTEIEATTRGDVDNMVVNLASGEGGFIVFDEEGGTKGVQAQFHIEVRKETPVTNGPSTFDSWYRIPDPRGTGPSGSGKAANEFQVVAETINQQFWSFDIRNLIDKNAEGASGNGANATALRKAQSDFVRGRYSVRLRRTNPVSSTNNSSVADDLTFSSLTEVLDEALNLPGTALVGFHALGSEKLNGGAPNVTCVVKGRRDVVNVQTSSTDPSGYRWVPRVENQSNRVWASIDLLTNRRYGAGEHFGLTTHVDIPSAIECAAWLDEQVNKGDGSDDTEIRSQLDIVLDTRKPVMEHLRDMLTPGRVWAVQRGDTWYFVKDDAVDLTTVPVVYDDTREGRTAQNSLNFNHDTVVSRTTEVQVTYLDETADFQPKEVWVVPEEPDTSPRRIRRVTAFGTVRTSEASRYGLHVFRQLSVQGATVSVGVNPASMDFGAGDVIRIVSNRVGVDGYWRIFDIDFDTDTFFARVIGKQYVPANYGQTDPRQRVITNGFTRLLAPPIPHIRAPAASTPAETVSGGSTPTARRVRVPRVRSQRRARGVLRARVKRRA